MTGTSRYIALKNYAFDKPIAAHYFEIKEMKIPEIKKDQVILQPIVFSIDPAIRLMMSGNHNKFPHQFEIGAPVKWFGVAKIVASTHSQFKTGDVVTGMMDWADYCIWDDNQKRIGQDLQHVPPFVKNPSHALGILGISGLTAYFGVMKISKPQPGETMVISSAAGGVGSIAGQIAKISGTTVIGLTSSKEKVDLLLRNGFDAALDYKSKDFEAQLKRTLPNGIDIYYDNVGGVLSQTIMKNMHYPARVTECGQIAIYNDNNPGLMVDIQHIHNNGLRFQGFNLMHFQDEFQPALVQLANWVDEGKINPIESIYNGLEALPIALTALFGGNNVGKVLVMSQQY